MKKQYPIYPNDGYLKRTILSTLPIVVIFIIIYIFLVVSDSNTPKFDEDNPQSRAISVEGVSVSEIVPSTTQFSTDIAIPKITIHQEDVIISFNEPKEDDSKAYIFYSDNPLTPGKGRISGPSGEETWYNLDMSQVVSNMRSIGFDQENYPHWIRGDGVKMLGNYVMVAANINARPKGTILETSLGLGIVCDTGEFADINQNQIDIATNW